jgi:nitrogen regulatory protein PII-like uncharacterized protein
METGIIWRESRYRNGVHPLETEVDGRFFILVMGHHGTWYLYRIDGEALTPSKTNFDWRDVLFEHIFDAEIYSENAVTLAKVLSEKIINKYDESWEEKFREGKWDSKTG